ncbi:hypothetical protein AMK16_05300 [Streptomyces sp. CB00455]|uniref:hypothetical protein n=1 Tax=Streptomyces sp. CB00455 TaxID=1703927 RepID=UPI000939D626|nr:hypothetical protein [Streptomyces sp. CB00455]OKK22528.1 hypothetical protein AMK16_05300 [Streptomyces sp. CB00455]
MRRVRKAAAVGAALLGPLLLAGCGIKPTGVIESGAPATVVIGPPDRAGVVYFVTPDGKLVPSPQVDSPPSSPTGTLLRLLSGPGPQERAAGLGTQLPALEGRDAGSLGMTVLTGGYVEARVPIEIGNLSQLARRQLACTVLSLAPSESTAEDVMLRGPDAALLGERCDIAR